MCDYAQLKCSCVKMEAPSRVNRTRNLGGHPVTLKNYLGKYYFIKWVRVR